MTSKPSIFVSIASYRDPELIPTIVNLLRTWSGETFITINVCLQDTDSYHMELLSHNFQNLFVDFVDYKESRGVCWARKKLQNLVRNETYFLQIDSHMRFIQNWDKELINNFLQTNNPKAVLSCYPPTYQREDPDNNYLSEKYSNITEYNELFIFGAYKCVGGKYNETGLPVPNVRISAGFIFTISKWIYEVPYPDVIYFNGEEDWLTVMSYTKGWDIFCPDKPIVFHCYQDNREASQEKYRNLHWEDHGEDTRDKSIIKDLYKGKFTNGYQRSVDQLFDCIKKQSPRRILIQLDLAEIPQKKYNFWVFCLLDGQSREVYRQDIYDQSVLSHKLNNYLLNCDASIWRTATKYMIWPVNEKGDFETKIFFDIKDWDVIYPNQTFSYYSYENNRKASNALYTEVEQQSPCDYWLKLDFSELPQKKYKVWVFCLLDEEGKEIYRQDIYDQSVFSRQSNMYKLNCDYYTRELAEKYMIWPVTENDEFEEKLFSEIKGWYIFSPNQAGSYHSEKGKKKVVNVLVKGIEKQSPSHHATKSDIAKLPSKKFHILLWGIAPYDKKIYIYHESEQCLRTAIKYGLTPEIIGLGYDGGDAPKGIQTQNRFYVLEKKLKTISDDDIVLVMDSFDTLFCGTESEMISRFESFNTEILFSAERCFTYQWFEYQKNYETVTSPYKYLNAGTYIGYAHALRRFTKECIQMTRKDQYKNGFEMGIMGAYLHENFFQKEKYRFDNNCDLFWVTTMDPLVEFKNYTLYNRSTNTHPLVLHFIDGKRYKKSDYLKCFNHIMRKLP